MMKIDHFAGFRRLLPTHRVWGEVAIFQENGLRTTTPP
jgi:hypothetical protein